MSHGAEDTGAPNLTPLLDVVLQLIMFFMLCANFVMEQVNESIKLPEATAAKALDRTQTSLLYLNVAFNGHVLRTDGPPLTNPKELEVYMRNQYRDIQAILRADKKGATEKVETTVIIRADARCTFEQVYNVMLACKAAGFEKLQLRAIVSDGTSATGGGAAS
ncbi:ExbD/TolR family protein [Tuwongella immobilis]|uniref:Biopolymer transporter ExbD n=1 Tax=Tuwongella immobilis TaxID=692036 RepID=A0A6C2YP74_9BACT|nr:biopolymer transporter ExbD [Tuwongella immobilis]VIP03167.1 biopolymer transport protein : Biopolymer transport protein OS=Singulisphaera acidiphila (strain ATCC BAA-1392 / DSM 18658 / VKM B-2454 / MOB10) GN=Sinac_5150 PE=3 SV=1: ExbD [Tuwongella immobilis]VTS03588.1 biopolymer transport protein : Biopolymer transport protein OS=Singulisphaera acidiphila (strain ATCC BAA-1392 / DSM 18658 / VKM B-2454 / MOB10) GN=Sinac_5150 PE=3 SV=1: ExbD [Tuwongella immobilis]